MPSPRTEPAPGPEPAGRLHLPRGLAAFFQRLNTRLVLAIGSVALVGLIVSAIAINQILPEYFAEQTRERLSSALVSTRLLIDIFAQREGPGSNASEVRDIQVLRPVTEIASNVLIPATVEIADENGRIVARASPPDRAALEAQGLRLDPEVAPQNLPFEFRAPGLSPDQPGAPLTITISNPYTSREATLGQIRSAITGAGLLALVAAVIFGAVAARRVTAPIHRLRAIAGRVAQGHLDERATASGVLEVDELAAQFNVMADRLSGTLRMLEADRDRLREFVADVSHELRTPIAALKMYAELQRDGQVDEATRVEFLERSTEQIARLEWLSTNLLDLSRIDAGIFPLDMRDGDLRDPTQAVVQALSEVAVARGIGLESFVPGEPVELRFDRERIVQLLTNLVGNALKFTPRGGGVSVHLTDEPDGVTIEVRDTGPGIPPDELPRIFDRFYRGTNTGEARASGSGLGLAIVRSIVDMHDGEIDVVSAVGEGTVFRIRLPREAAAQPVAATHNINETSRGSHPVHNPESVI
jgi:signal transduction histidine kinase